MNMMVYVYGEGKEILKIAFDSLSFWSRDRNS